MIAFLLAWLAASLFAALKLGAFMKDESTDGPIDQQEDKR